MRLQLSCCLLALLMAAEHALAQSFFAPLPPEAPALRSPSAGATVAAGALNVAPGAASDGQLLDARPTVVWRHGGFYPYFPRPATPTHFAICVYDPAVSASCTPANANWLAPVGTVPSAPASPISGGLPGQYDYTFRPSADLPATLLDRTVRWKVGACVMGAQLTCAFSAERDVRLSTRNLVAQKVLLRDSRANILVLQYRVSNKGTTGSGASFTQINFWNALMTAGQACQRDVNDPQVAGTDVVITDFGNLVTVSQLPLDASGRRIPPAGNVQAIHRPTTWSSVSFGDPRGSIPGGGALHEFSFPPVATPLTAPRAYAARVILDVANAVREFNEGDNWRAECHVVQE